MAKPRPSETSASYVDHLKFNTAQRPDATGTDETPSIANTQRNWDIFRLLPLKPDNDFGWKSVYKY
ncbi:hypothetical protein M3Y98_00553600 [Aphelenchoides besseyi]|nr:hypothetical protein M3Y98_00553600 [Aphelenchoides besseyi]